MQGSYFENSALAKARRILQPPEKVLVAFNWPSGEKPKPAKIWAALAGALSASMA